MLGHEGLQAFAPREQLVLAELVCPGGGVRHEVRDPDAARQQRGEIRPAHPGYPVDGRVQQPGRDEGRAEPVGRVAEVDLPGCREQARVDPDEHQPDSRPDEVWHLS